MTNTHRHVLKNEKFSKPFFQIDKYDKIIIFEPKNSRYVADSYQYRKNNAINRFYKINIAD